MESMVPGFVRHTVVTARFGLIPIQRVLFCCAIWPLPDAKGAQQCPITTSKERLANRKPGSHSAGGKSGRGCLWQTGHVWSPTLVALILEHGRFLSPCLRIVTSVQCECSIRSPKICTPWPAG